MNPMICYFYLKVVLQTNLPTDSSEEVFFHIQKKVSKSIGKIKIKCKREELK